MLDPAHPRLLGEVGGLSGAWTRSTGPSGVSPASTMPAPRLVAQPRALPPIRQGML